jgi:sugar O-acyltransferase (sialic acid O-acetyltransferase NeuD family)
MLKTCIILGAGGHARVLIDSLQQLPHVDIFGILTPDRDLAGKDIYTVPVLGDDGRLSEMYSRGVRYFVVGLGGIGNNLPRRRLYDLGLQNGLTALTVQHPSAIISNKTVIGAGCQLLAGCIVNAGAELGMNVIVNSGAIVEHDCQIGDHVHIASGAKVSGTVKIEDGAHIGAGATVRQNIRIGRNALIGAGAVVVKDVPPDVVVAGNPAKLMHKVEM